MRQLLFQFVGLFGCFDWICIVSTIFGELIQDWCMLSVAECMSFIPATPSFTFDDMKLVFATFFSCVIADIITWLDRFVIENFWNPDV